MPLFPIRKHAPTPRPHKRAKIKHNLGNFGQEEEKENQDVEKKGRAREGPTFPDLVGCKQGSGSISSFRRKTIKTLTPYMC